MRPGPIVTAGLLRPPRRAGAMCGNCARLGRRHFLALSAAAPMLAGCDDISLVSDDTVRAMGLRAWEEIRQTSRPTRDESTTRAARQVTERLLAAAGEPAAAWEVAVFAGTEVNAFALPGNKIGIYEGMFRVIGSPDQLAAVIGHEIGHLQAEHSQERMTAALAREHGLAMLYRLLQLGDVEFAGAIAAALGVGVEFGLVLPYSRRQELEADRLGVHLMDAAGFDPREAAVLWRNMAAASERRSPEFLATHPAPASRIEQIEDLLAEL